MTDSMTHSPKDMSALVERLRSSAKAFRENTVYGQGGDPLRLGVQAAECDEAADALESMAAEITALQAKAEEARGVIEHFDSELRVRIWNSCKARNMKDDSAILAVEGAMAEIKKRVPEAAHWLAEKPGEGGA